MRKLLAGSALAFALFGWTGAAFAATHAVSINDSSFSPSSITVTKGDTVKWTPKGGESHTVTAKDGSFNSDASGQCQSTHYEGCLIGGSDTSPGIKKSFSYQFTKTGTFGYTCKVHGFSGTVTVKAAATPKPTAAPKIIDPVPSTPTATAKAAATSSPSEAPTPTETDAPLPTSTLEAVPLTAEESSDSNGGLLIAAVLGGVVVGGGLVALAVTRLRRPA